MIDSNLHALLDEYSYPVLFATITGSHAFGCASPESDYDIHGVHLLPVQELLGLGELRETIEHKTVQDRQEVDIATHDLRKFVRLLLKGNGNVLEDLYSPLVVLSSPLHDELKELGKGCITKQVALHYKGMAFNQQRRMQNNELKKYIHTYRCLLMGIHLMLTGNLEMDLPTLANEYAYTTIHRLIEWKLQGLDYLPDGERAEYHTENFAMLTDLLMDAQRGSHLPEQATTGKELEQLVIRVRLNGRIN